MLSVIIPTIQKKMNVLVKLVNILKQDACVSEILLINNLPEKSINLDIFSQENIDKVNIIIPKSNLFVNGSWNYGVQICKNNNFVLFNDDLLVCKDFCSAVVNSEFFNSENTGLLGFDTRSIQEFPFETEDLDFPVGDISEISFSRQDRYMSTGNWGSVIFGKRQNYYAIPNDLKIIYGDNFLLYCNMKLGKINYKIGGMKIHHIGSSSSRSSEVSQEVAGDIKNSKKYLK